MAELGLAGGCHAKGFSQRLDWGDAETEDLARAFGREMERGDVVVWDGDDYAEDSFTKVLAGLPENVRLVAVRCRVHVDAFVESWSGIAEQNQRTIVCVAVEDMDETTKGPEGSLGWWEELGVLALQATQVKRVVCLGGGVCVEHEARRAPRTSRSRRSVPSAAARSDRARRWRCGRRRRSEMCRPSPGWKRSARFMTLTNSGRAWARVGSARCTLRWTARQASHARSRCSHATR